MTTITVTNCDDCPACNVDSIEDILVCALNGLVYVGFENAIPLGAPSAPTPSRYTLTSGRLRRRNPLELGIRSMTL
jgi:hypothetical protein